VLLNRPPLWFLGKASFADLLLKYITAWLRSTRYPSAGGEAPGKQVWVKAYAGPIGPPKTLIFMLFKLMASYRSLNKLAPLPKG
jgi:hypothetical protein